MCSVCFIAGRELNTMLLEIREVSRKTARDGRVEITETTARRLAMLPSRFPVAVDDAPGEAILVAFRCTCERRGQSDADGEGHQHHFVESSLFQVLPAGESIVLELLDGARLAVARPHPLRS